MDTFSINSRERNRQHAKQTRIRKKWQMEALKTQLLQLQDEVSLYLLFDFI